MFEYFRIPVANIQNVDYSKENQKATYAVELMKGNVKPVIVSKIGFNKETMEVEYKCLLNDEMAAAIFINRLEYVSCIVIDEKDLETVKKMF